MKPPHRCVGKRQQQLERVNLSVHLRGPCHGSASSLRLPCRFHPLPPPTDSPWKVHLSDVGPETTGVTVHGLTPARTYQFRVCAVNRVGRGQYSAETSRYAGGGGSNTSPYRGPSPYLGRSSHPEPFVHPCPLWGSAGASVSRIKSGGGHPWASEQVHIRTPNHCVFCVSQSPTTPREYEGSGDLRRHQCLTQPLFLQADAA